MARWEQAAIKREGAEQPRWTTAPIKQEQGSAAGVPKMRSTDPLDRGPGDWITNDTLERMKTEIAPSQRGYQAPPARPTRPYVETGPSKFVDVQNRDWVSPPPRPEEIGFPQSQGPNLPDPAQEARDYQGSGGRVGELFREGKDKLFANDPLGSAMPFLSAATGAAQEYLTDPNTNLDQKISGAVRGLTEFSGAAGGIRADDFEKGTTVWQDMGGDPLPRDYNPNADRASQLLGAMFAGGRGQIGKMGGARAMGAGVGRELSNAGLDALTNLTGGASDAAIMVGKPFVAGGRAGAEGVADLLARRGGQQGGTPPAPPVAPPGVNALAAPTAPASSGAQGPLQGNLRRMNAQGAPAGAATRSFNAMSAKTRESALRALTNSGMSRDQAFDAIRSLDNLPPDRQSNFEFELLRRYGGEFPDLEANLSAMGRKWATESPRPRQILGGQDSARQVMNDEIRAQINSEGKFVTATAEKNFGPGIVPAEEALEKELDALSAAYESILSTKRNPTGRLRSQGKKDAVYQAREELQQYLKSPDVVQNLPDWVRKQVMLQASDDMRRLKFTPEEMKTILAGDGKVLAPLFQSHGPINWSPQLWNHLVTQYPTQAAHSLQSAYRVAGDTAMARGTVADIADAKMLQRLRGESGEGGLLDTLERAVPNYKETRVKFGDRKSAQRALELLEDFKRAAASEGDVAGIIRDLKKLPPRHRDMAQQQITSIVRQEILRKIDSPKPSELGQTDRLLTPNLTALSKADFLKALEDVFGPEGKELADAIRWARSSTDNLTSIHPKYNSRSITNLEDVKNADAIYEDPLTQSKNLLDIPAGVAGAGGAIAAFVPGGQMAAVAGLSMAAAKGLWNAYKAGKRLNNREKSQLAEFFFKSRQATPDAEDLAGIPGPRGPSPAGYVGNVAVGAGVGAASAEATGNDPITGAAIGAAAGGARAAMRGARAARSVIPTEGVNALSTPSKPPPEKGGMGTVSEFPPELGGTVLGGGVGYTVAPEDEKGKGLLLGAVVGGLGGHLARRSGFDPLNTRASRNARYDELKRARQSKPDIVNAARQWADPNAPRVGDHPGLIEHNKSQDVKAKVDAWRQWAVANGVPEKTALAPRPVDFDPSRFKDPVGKRLAQAATDANDDYVRWINDVREVADEMRAAAKGPPDKAGFFPSGSRQPLPMDEGKLPFEARTYRNGVTRHRFDSTRGPINVAYRPDGNVEWSFEKGSPTGRAGEGLNDIGRILVRSILHQAETTGNRTFHFGTASLAHENVYNRVLSKLGDIRQLPDGTTQLTLRPSSEGSSKLLAGAPKEELFAGGIGASAGANFDYDGDGTISDEERIAGAIGGFAVGAGGMKAAKAWKPGGKTVERQGMAAPARRPEPPTPANDTVPVAPKTTPASPPNISYKGGGGGGGWGSGPRDDWPFPARHVLGGASGGLGGLTVGGIAGSTSDLDGDGVAGTPNDIRIGTATGLGVGAAGGLGIAQLLRMNAIAHASKASGKRVQDLADAIVKAQGFPNAISAQQTVIDTLKQKGASADRIDMAERVLAALHRRTKESNDILDRRAPPKSNVTPLGGKRPPEAQGFPPGGGGEGRNGLTDPLPPKMRGPKTAKPPMSRAEEAARQEVKAARSAHSRADNKYVMKADREKYVQPALERMAAAEAKLAKVQQTDAAVRTAGARAKDVVSGSMGKAIGAGAGIGLGLGAGVAGVNMLAPDAPKNVMSTSDPRYYWSTVTKDKAKMTRVQSALEEWGEWPVTEKGYPVEQTGNYGQTTKDAIRAWRARRGKNPDAPMTRKDTAELLAGPKGYEGNDGKWNYSGSVVPPL